MSAQGKELGSNVTVSAEDSFCEWMETCIVAPRSLKQEDDEFKGPCYIV